MKGVKIMEKEKENFLLELGEKFVDLIFNGFGGLILLVGTIVVLVFVGIGAFVGLDLISTAGKLLFDFAETAKDILLG